MSRCVQVGQDCFGMWRMWEFAKQNRIFFWVCLAMAHHSRACWDLTSTFNFSISTSVEPRFGWTEVRLNRGMLSSTASTANLQTPVLMWCNLSLFLGPWPGGETSLRAFDAAPDSILWHPTRAWDFDSEWIRMIPNLQIWYHMVHTCSYDSYEVMKATSNVNGERPVRTESYGSCWFLFVPFLPHWAPQSSVSTPSESSFGWQKGSVNTELAHVSTSRRNGTKITALAQHNLLPYFLRSVRTRRNQHLSEWNIFQGLRGTAALSFMRKSA